MYWPTLRELRANGFAQSYPTEGTDWMTPEEEEMDEQLFKEWEQQSAETHNQARAQERASVKLADRQ